MASYDPTDESHYYLFCLFIVTRCFRKLSKRVYLDRECWNVNISQKISDWTPDDEDLDGVRWIDRPQWALEVLLPNSIGPDGMTSKEILKSGQFVTQWEFSAATLKSWAWLLVRILKQLELSVTETKVAREKKQTDQEVKHMSNINGLCHILHMYVHWKEDVVKTLLTKTSLAHQFHFRVPFKLKMSGM